MNHKRIRHTIPELTALASMNDEEIIIICQNRYKSDLIEDINAWNDLGPEFHARLDKNYPVEVRVYTTKLTELKLSKKVLTKRPISWTIRALPPAGMFFDKVVTATKTGTEVGVLDAKHFPQVTIPQALAEHIKGAALKYL